MNSVVVTKEDTVGNQCTDVRKELQNAQSIGHISRSAANNYFFSPTNLLNIISTYRIIRTIALFSPPVQHKIFRLLQINKCHSHRYHWGGDNNARVVVKIVALVSTAGNSCCLN